MTEPTIAELASALRALESRLAALESAPQPAEASFRPTATLPVIEWLKDVVAAQPPDAGPVQGAVTYAGFGRGGGEQLAWQMVRTAADLLSLDEEALARTLAAVASPMRLRILRELVPGPLKSQELQERLEEPSAGQLYHHLRELLAVGVISQPRRSVYELPPRNVVPVLALLACAADLQSPGGTAAD